MKYNISPSDFWNNDQYYEYFPSVEKAINDTKDPINQLCLRYNLRSKRILSLGSGNAFEEYWMYKNGVNLILNDLGADYSSLSKYINNLPIGDGLTYYLEDANETIKKLNSIDALYVSSFTPDELRRGQIQREVRLNNKKNLWRLIEGHTWPEDRHPYHKIIRDSISLVKRDGLVIFQHYCGGIHPLKFKNYYPLLIKRFKELDLTVIDIYAKRLNNSIILITAIKGDSIPKLGPEIRTFHGRCDPIIGKDIIKIFDYNSGYKQPKLLNTLFLKAIHTSKTLLK